MTLTEAVWRSFNHIAPLPEETKQRLLKANARCKRDLLESVHDFGGCCVAYGATCELGEPKEPS